MDETIMRQTRLGRQARIIRARFTLQGRPAGTLLIRNISEGGVGARCDCPYMRVGDDICIDLPVLGEVTGRVRWIQDGYCGIRMDEGLDVDRLRFRPDANLLSGPEPFSVADHFQPSASTYRPGVRSFHG